MYKKMLQSFDMGNHNVEMGRYVEGFVVTIIIWTDSNVKETRTGLFQVQDRQFN
jgi:hypothetical protein